MYNPLYQAVHSMIQTVHLMRKLSSGFILVVFATEACQTWEETDDSAKVDLETRARAKARRARARARARESRRRSNGRP